jgi:hypothetical protein
MGARTGSNPSPEPVPKSNAGQLPLPGPSLFAGVLDFSRCRDDRQPPPFHGGAPSSRARRRFAGSRGSRSCLAPAPLLDQEGLDDSQKWRICRYLSPLRDSNPGPPPYHQRSGVCRRLRGVADPPGFAVFACTRFATGCRRLRPLGSINAPCLARWLNSRSRRTAGVGLGSHPRQPSIRRRCGGPGVEMARPRASRVSRAPIFRRGRLST